MVSSSNKPHHAFVHDKPYHAFVHFVTFIRNHIQLWQKLRSRQHTATHTRLTASFPGQPGSADTRSSPWITTTRIPTQFL